MHYIHIIYCNVFDKKRRNFFVSFKCKFCTTTTRIRLVHYYFHYRKVPLLLLCFLCCQTIDIVNAIVSRAISSNQWKTNVKRGRMKQWDHYYHICLRFEQQSIHCKFVYISTMNEMKSDEFTIKNKINLKFKFN